MLNHLQDCADDYRQLDRVYLPLEDLAAEGTGVEALASGVSNAALRRVLDRLLDRTAALIDQARGLPPLVASRGLRWESGVIVGLAARLLRRLRRDDPLACASRCANPISLRPLLSASREAVGDE